MKKKTAVETKAANPETAHRAAPDCRRDTPLAIRGGELDMSALRSVMREWLVPRLVEDFLLKRGIELKYSRARTNSGKKPNSEY